MGRAGYRPQYFLVLMRHCISNGCLRFCQMSGQVSNHVLVTTKDTYMIVFYAKFYCGWFRSSMVKIIKRRKKMFVFKWKRMGNVQKLTIDLLCQQKSWDFMAWALMWTNVNILLHPPLSDSALLVVQLLNIVQILLYQLLTHSLLRRGIFLFFFFATCS